MNEFTGGMITGGLVAALVVGRVAYWVGLRVAWRRLMANSKATPWRIISGG
jgi:hypothetical protein